MSKPMNTWEERLVMIIKNALHLRTQGIAWAISDELPPAYQPIKEFIASELQQQRREIVEMIKGMKVGSWKDWIKATKPYGGTREEWNKLQSSKTWDEALDDIIKKVGKHD